MEILNIFRTGRKKNFKEISKFRIEYREEFLNFNRTEDGNFQISNFEISQFQRPKISKFPNSSAKKEKKKKERGEKQRVVCYKHGMRNRKGWNRCRVRVTRGDIDNRYLVGGQHLSMPLRIASRRNPRA